MERRRDRIDDYVDMLTSCARKGNSDIGRTLAMQGLAKASALSTSAAAELGSYANDTNPDIRYKALELLVSVGSSASYARSDLETRIRLGDSDERALAAKVIGGIGITSEHEILKISQTASPVDNRWIYGVVAAYSGIRNVEVEQGLLEGLQEREYSVRLAVAEALGHYRPLTPKLRSQLLERFNESLQAHPPGRRPESCGNCRSLWLES